MSGRFRVGLSPVAGIAQDEQPRTSAHGHLTLSRFGAGASSLDKGESKSAELVFHVAFLEVVRGVSAPEFEEFARISGQLEVRGSFLDPVMILSNEMEVRNTASSEAAEPPRFIALSFDGERFEQAPSGENAPRLVLPQAPALTQHVEIGVELFVDGSKEAEMELNDRLDLPFGLVPTEGDNLLRLRVGRPYEGANVKGRSYRITIGEDEWTGTIPESGEVVLPKPMESGRARLEVQPYLGSDQWYGWDLELGQLAEVDEVSGVQARLNAQSFGAGAVDGELGPATEQALTAFQHRHELLADGSMSQETKDKLREVHGC